MTMTREELKTLSVETFYDNSEGGITPYAHREFNNKLIDSIPDGSIQIPLTDIPVGYNMRGKTVTFTNTDKIPDNIIGFDDYYLRFKDISDFYIAAGPSGPGRGRAIWITNGESSWTQCKYIYDANKTGWLLDTYTFSNDRDYIVESNSLPKHIATDWGFDYATVSGAIEDALSYKQDKLIAGTGINIASDGKTISVQTCTPTFIVDSNAALSQWASNISGHDYSYVLIKKGTWTTTVNQSGINLPDTKTQLIVGEPGSVVNLNLLIGGGSISSFGIFASGGSPGIEPLPGARAYGLTLNINTEESPTGIIDQYNVYGVYGFSHMEDCYVTLENMVNEDGYSSIFESYAYCYNLYNCFGSVSAIATAQTVPSETAFAYAQCKYLTSCSGRANGSLEITVFQSCEHLTSCESHTFNAAPETGFAGYDNCKYLYGCKAVLGSFAPPYNYHGFYSCQAMFGCASTIMLPNASSVPSSFRCYTSCKDLHACSGSCRPAGGVVFYGCRIMFGCYRTNSLSNGTMFSGCYMSSTGTTYPVANTASGGYNRDTI